MARRNRTRLAQVPALPVPIRGDPGGSAMYESPRAPLIAVPAPYPSQVAAMSKARADEEVTGAAHGDQQRTVALELSHRISLAGEAVVGLGGELGIVSAEIAVRKIIDRHRRPVIADLAMLSFCDARGLAALVRMAGYTEQMGCTFRLASPSCPWSRSCGSPAWTAGSMPSGYLSKRPAFACPEPSRLSVTGPVREVPERG